MTRIQAWYHTFQAECRSCPILHRGLASHGHATPHYRVAGMGPITIVIGNCNRDYNRFMRDRDNRNPCPVYLM